jgi:hypothetical protein
MKKTLPDGTMIFSVAPAEIPEGYEATGGPRARGLTAKPAQGLDLFEHRKH